MMKINVEFDTQEKTISATVDGKAVDNLSSIMFYTYDGKANCELATVEQDENEKMVKVNKIYAASKDCFVTKDEPLHRLIAREIFGIKDKDNNIYSA